MKIVWSPLAVEKVAEIADYIAKDKPSAAEEWLNTLFAKVERLEASPKIGRKVPEISQSHSSTSGTLLYPQCQDNAWL
jgi:toxin ParE1/3/4